MGFDLLLGRLNGVLGFLNSVAYVLGPILFPLLSLLQRAGSRLQDLDLLVLDSVAALVLTGASLEIGDLVVLLDVLVLGLTQPFC